MCRSFKQTSSKQATPNTPGNIQNFSHLIEYANSMFHFVCARVRACEHVCMRERERDRERDAEKMGSSQEVPS